MLHCRNEKIISAAKGFAVPAAPLGGAAPGRRFVRRSNGADSRGYARGA
jgi:hypothetical protein